MELNWQKPGPAHRGRPRLLTDAMLETLRANPGRWALIKTYGPAGSGMATSARKTYGVEATMRSRTLDDGSKVFDLYVRWPEAAS